MDSSPYRFPKVGIDTAEVSRIQDIVLRGGSVLERFFLKSERDYCSSYQDSALHFAGTFAAKEAVSKALGVQKYPFMFIEVLRREDGSPEAYFQGERLPVSISITYTKELATAIAIG
jgi:holo-[acyl-carrier protein] synthase